MVAVCRNKQRSRPDNFWGSRVSALDPAVTKSTAAAAAVTSGHYTDNKAPRYTRLQGSHVSMGITEP